MMSKEQTYWNRFLDYAMKLQAQGRIAEARVRQLKTLSNMGWTDSSLLRDLSGTAKAGKTAFRTITHVNSRRLGVRTSANGADIDLMAPAGTTGDEIQGMFGGVLIIAIGVVVVVGIVASAIVALNEAVKINARARALVTEADRLLSSDPIRRQEWAEIKDRENWRAEEGIIERLSRTGESFFGKIGIGIAAGIALFLALKGYHGQN